MINPFILTNMKPIIHFLFVSLLIGLSFSQTQGQNTVYGIGTGTGGLSNAHIGYCQGMIPVLVEALQSLSAQKDSAAVMNVAMAQQIIVKNQRLGALEKSVGRQKPTSSDNILATDYGLGQNHPNPFRQSTTIRYQVAEEAQQVGLLITNLQGVEEQRFDQLSAGAGEVQIIAGSLTPGTYVCTLFADGLFIGSHRMILTR
jgi:hypothetical protein